MKINHKSNFFYGFAYVPYKRQGAFARNCIKGVAYVPIMGAISQAALAAVIFASKKQDTDDWFIGIAFTCRAILAIPGPLLLPIIDVIATLWQARDEKKFGIN